MEKSAFHSGICRLRQARPRLPPCLRLHRMAGFGGSIAGREAQPDAGTGVESFKRNSPLMLRALPRSCLRCSLASGRTRLAAASRRSIAANTPCPFSASPWRAANFDSRIDRESLFDRRVRSRAPGLAPFLRHQGHDSASGDFHGRCYQAGHVSAPITSTARSRRWSTSSFADGNVAKVINDPPLKKRGKDWVPIGPDDLKSVVDPIAATLVKCQQPRRGLPRPVQDV